MPAPHFIVHDKTDSVGVVVVEGVKKGQMLTGWVMQGNKTIRMKCLNAIPIGHKIAMKALKSMFALTLSRFASPSAFPTTHPRRQPAML